MVQELEKTARLRQWAEAKVSAAYSRWAGENWPPFCTLQSQQTVLFWCNVRCFRAK